jgi:proline iminopeptidase
MKHILSLCCLLLACICAGAQSLYMKTYGNSHARPLIYIHGGPGSSSASFEATTAQQLANLGFYVILYDRRGEGRSIDPHAQFTLAQTISDLDTIYALTGVKKATLLAMSWGGVVGVKYAEAHPEKVSSLVLISALIDFQQTYKTILRSCKAIYLSKNDTAGLNAIAGIEKMDSTSYEYRNSCFQQATRNGFFKTPTSSPVAQALYTKMENDTLITNLPDQHNQPAYSFWQHEKYSSLNLMPDLAQLSDKIKLYAIYGKDDGLYSPAQVAAIRQLTGDKQLLYLDQASHYIFIDQQEAFLRTLQYWLNKDKNMKRKIVF